MTGERLPERLLNKNFVLLWQGQFVSRFGNAAFGVAMMFWLKHATGSASLMGLLMMLSMLPAVVLGPVGGTISDRFSRRKILILSDAANGIAILSLALMISYSPASTRLLTAWLFVVSIFVGVMSAFFRPAISASIPDLVPEEKLAAANSMNQSSFQVSGLLGQGMGGVLYRILGAPVLILIDAITFLFSAFSETFIEIPQKTGKAAGSAKEVLRSFWHDTAQGAVYIWKRRGMRDLLFASAFLNFFFAPIIALLPFYVEDHLGAAPDWYGFLGAATSVGALVGYLLAGAIKIPAGARSALMAGQLVLVSALFASMGLTKTPVVSLVMIFVMGIAIGMINIQITTILQLATPSGIRGRVFGLIGTISGGLMPIGMGLAGVIADMTRKNIPVIFAVSGTVVAFLSLLTYASRNFREFVASEPIASTDSGEGPIENP